MKFSNYFIIFLMMLLFATVLMYFTTVTNTTISEEDEKYREMHYAAVENALVKVVNNIDLSESEAILWTPENMIKAREELNNLFELRLNYSINSTNDTTDWLCPLICYMDYNGFYVTYIGTDNDGTASDKKVTSGLNTWTTAIDLYSIQYYLGKDILTVTNNEGHTFTGTYDEINIHFNYPSFLKKYTYEKTIDDEQIKVVNAELFNKDKENFIILRTEEILNYYLNNKDNTIGKLGRHIELSFDLNDDAFHKMFHNVGIIAFMQGPTYNNTYDKTPICAYAHYQVVEDNITFVITTENGVLYYHDKNCDIMSNQEYVTECNSMRDAALYGASFCPYCH